MPSPCFEPLSGCVAVPAESALTLVVCARLPMFPVCIRTRGFFRTCAVDRLDEMFNWEYGGMNGDGGSHHTRMARGVGPYPFAPPPPPPPLLLVLPRGRREGEGEGEGEGGEGATDTKVRPSYCDDKLKNVARGTSGLTVDESLCEDPPTKLSPSPDDTVDDAGSVRGRRQVRGNECTTHEECEWEYATPYYCGDTTRMYREDGSEYSTEGSCEECDHRHESVSTGCTKYSVVYSDSESQQTVCPSRCTEAPAPPPPPPPSNDDADDSANERDTSCKRGEDCSQCPGGCGPGSRFVCLGRPPYMSPPQDPGGCPQDTPNASPSPSPSPSGSSGSGACEDDQEQFESYLGMTSWIVALCFAITTFIEFSALVARKSTDVTPVLLSGAGSVQNLSVHSWGCTRSRPFHSRATVGSTSLAVKPETTPRLCVLDPPLDSPVGVF